MASTEPEKVAPPPETIAREPEKAAPPPPPPPRDYFALADFVLRAVVFAAALVAVVVVVTSKEREFVRLPVPPFPVVRRTAKFNYSPAYIYFVVALSVAGLYSLITAALSLFVLLKPNCRAKLFPHFVIFDVLMLGIVAAAIGAAGGVGYIGLKGNSHSGWLKICDDFDKFCQHLAGSLAVSLFASVLLVFLVLLSVYTLSRKIPQVVCVCV